MFTSGRVGGSFGGFFGRLVDALDCCPWGSVAGRSQHGLGRQWEVPRPAPLYTPEQRLRRDTTPWTMVQGVLAPVQFAIFLVSLGLVLRCLATGEGYALATGSVVVKTFALYAIMVTGAVWEKAVFGRYLFAPAFLWEDVFSILVLALHTAYLAMVFAGIGDERSQLFLALAAYASYVINAAQFVLKLRAARLGQQAAARRPARGASGAMG